VCVYVWVLYCVGVCVCLDFVMCWCVYVWGLYLVFVCVGVFICWFVSCVCMCGCVYVWGLYRVCVCGFCIVWVCMCGVCIVFVCVCVCGCVCMCGVCIVCVYLWVCVYVGFCIVWLCFFIWHLFPSMLHYYGVILQALLVILHIFSLFIIYFKTLASYLCSILCSNLFCLYSFKFL